MTRATLALAALLAGCGAKKIDPGARGTAIVGGAPLTITGCVARRNAITGSDKEWLASRGLTESPGETEVTLSIEDHTIGTTIAIHALDLHFDPARSPENLDGKLEVDFHAPDENSAAVMVRGVRCDWTGPVRGDAPTAPRVTGSVKAHCPGDSAAITLDLDLVLDCPLAGAKR